MFYEGVVGAFGVYEGLKAFRIEGGRGSGFGAFPRFRSALRASASVWMNAYSHRIRMF